MSEVVIPTEPNQMTLTFNINPENGTFQLARAVRFQRGINPEVALWYVRLLEGVTYMLNYKPGEFVDYSLRIDDAIAVKESYRTVKPKDEGPKEFDLTNVHMLPNGRLH